MPSLITFENVLDYVGSAGKWQIGVYILTSMSGFFGALHNLGSIFLAGTPDHWCTVLEASNQSNWGANWTEERVKEYSIPLDSPGEYSRCYMYHNNDSDVFSLPWTQRLVDNTSDLLVEPCNSWTYNHSTFDSTVVTQWDLVCDRAPVAATVQSTYMLGVLLGSLFYGLFSDRFGRRYSILIALIQLTTGALLTLVPIHLIWFITFRFMTGMGGGGVFACCFVLMAEVISPKLRDIAGIAFQIPFGLGYMLLPLMAYYVRTWNMLQLIISLLTLSLLIYFWFLPESPRWLLLHDRCQEAYSILRTTAKINNADIFNSQELQSKLKYSRHLEYDFNKDSKVESSTWSIVSDLFKTPQMRKRILVSYFAWTAVALCYYGLSFESPTMAGANVYMVTFLTAATEIPSYILGCVTVRYLSRRLNVVGSFVIGGVCCLLILAVPPGHITIITALAITGKFFINIAYAVVYLYATEIFPTRNRNMALGTSAMCARAGAAVAPYIVDLLEGNTPLMIFGILAVVAGLLCILLPETKDKQLPQTITDVETDNESLITTAETEQIVIKANL